MGVVALLVAWGILVGQAVGAGGDRSWGKLLITALVAVVCLFASFMLIGRLWRKLTAEPERPAAPTASAAASASSQPAERAYVEDQSFADPGYGGQGADAYGSFDNPYAGPYADSYGDGSYGSGSYADGGSDPYGAGTKRPSYGVGNNRLPRRQSIPQPPPSTPPPAQPPGSQGSGRHSSYQSPSDSWAPPAADHGASSGAYYDTGAYDYGTGSYDTGSYGTGSYGSGGFDTGAYEIGGYNWSTGTYSGDQADYAHYEQGPATQSMPAPAQRAPRLPAQRDDDTWPPEPPRYRH